MQINTRTYFASLHNQYEAKTKLMHAHTDTLTAGIAVATVAESATQHGSDDRHVAKGHVKQSATIRQSTTYLPWDHVASGKVESASSQLSTLLYMT
jgi:hypothetical protein